MPQLGTAPSSERWIGIRALPEGTNESRLDESKPVLAEQEANRDLCNSSSWRLSPSAPAPSCCSSVAIRWSLWIHLFFAVSTFLLWIFVVVQALRRSPIPPAPDGYARSHRFQATLTALDMGMTAVTGCTFYVLAFVAWPRSQA